MVITDPDGAIQYINPAFERVTGYTREEVIGQNPRIVKSGEHNDAFYKELWDTLTSGETWSGRMLNKRKDGALYTEEATISPVRDASGKTVNYVAVKHDITREVELEDQLRQGQKMEAIGTLAGGIAHDFNNILYAIQGFNEIATAEVPEGSGLQKVHTEIKRAVDRATDLVDQILTFSRKSDVQRVPVRVPRILTEALKMLRATLPASVEFKSAIDPSCGAVLADPTQIHQIIVNLCTNAGHAMGEAGGLLSLRLEEIEVTENMQGAPVDLSSGKHIQLTVDDTGSGMEAETIARIFEPYFTTKPRGEGTGLGLSTVHGIVRDCGGAVDVESEVGRGTTFRLFFPVCVAPEAAAVVELDTDMRAADGGRILVVDDEQSIIMIQGSLLRAAGYEVVSFKDPLEALEAFRADPFGFDAVVTDLTMPGMSGYELAKQLHVAKPGVPVVLCTGHVQKVTKEKLEAAGIRGCLRKPVATRDLLDTVRRACGGQ